MSNRGHRDREPDDLHQAFATGLAQAIADKGVSLVWLQRRLADAGTPISVATLSYWRAGTRTPEHKHSWDAVETLESLLDLEPGHLTQLVGPSKRSGPPVTTEEIDKVMGMSGVARFINRSLGLPLDNTSTC